MAVASGNLVAITAIMSDDTKDIADIIEKSIGFLRYTYYGYMDNYHCKPYDLEDLVNGILYLDIKGLQIEEQRKRYEQDSK